MTSVLNNFASWLPPYGESDLTFESYEDGVILNVFYEDSSHKLCVRQIDFTNVKSFTVAITTCDLVGVLTKIDSRQSINALVRVSPSAYLQFYQNENLSKYGYVNHDLKHFMIFFTSESKVIHVIAENVKVSDSKFV